MSEEWKDIGCGVIRRVKWNNLERFLHVGRMHGGRLGKEICSSEGEGTREEDSWHSRKEKYRNILGRRPGRCEGDGTY